MKTDVPNLLRALNVQAKRKGSMLWAKCPHPGHDDSTASWRIIVDPQDPRYGQHRCYGCKWGGYAVHLIEVVLGITRDEARDWLERNGNSGPLPTDVEVVTSMPRGYRGFSLPRGVVLPDQLDPTEWPARVATYAASRGLVPWQIRKWGIGYALEGKLAGRIVFPIRDREARLISYTGRSFMGHELRYKDPLLKDGADLAAIMGPEFWEFAIRVPPVQELIHPVVLCEGALNGLAIERVTENVEIGALFGSNILPMHLCRLACARRVVIATDNDPAGNAVAEVLTEALGRQATITRLELPPKVDCEDLDPRDLRDRMRRALERLRRA